MVWFGIEKMPQKMQLPEEIRGKLQRAGNLGSAREAIQHFALEEVLDAFEKNKIACILLKGCLMKQFYPRPDLRMMADLDIIYRPEQEADVDRILVSKGYACDHKDDNHNVYFRMPFMNIEMHHGLMSEVSRFSGYYENIWPRAELLEGRKFVYRLRWEDFYIFMLTHLVKHFQNGGSGIRSVVDIWQFLDKMEEKLDWNYIGKELESIHMTAFDQHIRKLADIWFKGAEGNDLYDALTDYIINSGIYGTVRHYQVWKAAGALREDCKTVRQWQFRTRLRIIFFPLDLMKQQYPYLEKYPVLLPAAWMQRIFRALFKRRGRASKVLGEVKADQNEVFEKKKLFEELNI